MTGKLKLRKFTPMEIEAAAKMAKMVAYHCVRNTSIEDIHAGKTPSSNTDNFSDVKVVTPTREIPWNEVSRISGEEILASANFVNPNSNLYFNMWFSTVRMGFTTFNGTGMKGSFFTTPFVVNVSGTPILVDRVTVDSSGAITEVFQADAQCSSDGKAVSASYHYDLKAGSITVPKPKNLDCTKLNLGSIPISVNGVAGEAISGPRNGAIGVTSQGNFRFADLDADISVNVQSQSITILSLSSYLSAVPQFWAGNDGQYPDCPVEVWSDGSLKSGYIYGGVKFQKADGSTVKLGNGLFSKKVYSVYFDQSGKLVSATEVQK